MKKLFCIILALLTLLSFCGCKEKTKTETITAKNGDKIEITLTKADAPTVKISVNGDEIYFCDSFTEFEKEYNFEKDFNLDVVKEYSDDKILWAYKFNWGVVYASPYEDQTIYVAGAKHEHAKKCYGTYHYYHLAEKLDLVKFETYKETGEKFWHSNDALAQSVVEYFYKNQAYELKEVKDLNQSGYDIDKYYFWYDRELNKAPGVIYELYLEKEKTALLYIDATTSNMDIQEFEWENPKHIHVLSGNPHMVLELK